MTKKSISCFRGFVFSWLIAACASAAFAQSQTRPHVQALASDRFEGRLAGSNGERLAADYIVGELQKIGAKPLPGQKDFRLPFEFTAGEGPKIHNPVRSGTDIDRLITYRAAELGYVAESVRRVATHFGAKVPVIGFCGAPFTLASYMIEGSGSRNYIETKRLMYGNSEAWSVLMEKLVHVLAEYGTEQVRAGAAAFQVFDSWVGCLSPADYRKYALPHTRALVQRLKHSGVPVIYFGTDSATLLRDMKSTGADVIGLDWRIELHRGWDVLGHEVAVQGNLDPVVLFADEQTVRQRTRDVLDQAGGRAGHIFNLGHGILPGTPVENVIALVDEVHAYSERQMGVTA